MSEAIYRFKVTHKGETLCTLFAHSKWEAIQTAIFKFGANHEVKYLDAKKVS